jgi:DNA adenine methylase
MDKGAQESRANGTPIHEKAWTTGLTCCTPRRARQRDYSRREGVMNSFISWIGGKHILAKKIISIIPEHHCYVEVFGGAGWVLFKKPHSKVEAWNDLNSDLVNLFRVVRNYPIRFKRRQQYLLASREEYSAFQKAIKTGKFKDDIDRAIAFYYCIKNSFGSSVYNRWAYSPSRPPKYQSGMDHLVKASERLKNVYIENLSYEKLIPKWDRKDTIFYCDPPYYMLIGKKGKDYYQYSFNEDDHIRLRNTLKGIMGKFVLSYDDDPIIRDLYKSFNVIQTKPVLYSMNNKDQSTTRHARELIITNF